LFAGLSAGFVLIVDKVFPVVGHLNLIRGLIGRNGYFFPGSECISENAVEGSVNSDQSVICSTRNIMLTQVNPKLPMRNRAVTRNFYVEQLGFSEFGNGIYQEYLMVEKDQVQIHFFLFRDMDPKENDGQVYIRTDNIDEWYQFALEKKLPIPKAGYLEEKPWGQKEFSVLDPDHNLLTFGQSA
jgi:hypothetical protein